MFTKFRIVVILGLAIAAIWFALRPGWFAIAHRGPAPKEGSATSPQTAPSAQPAPAITQGQPPILPPSPVATVPPIPAPGAATVPSVRPLESAAPTVPAVGAGPVTVMEAGSTVGSPAAADLERVQLMLRGYRTLFGENPVGSNAEIMQAIAGANPKGAKIGPPEGMNLNSNGELVDHWGKPYFFHQLSSRQMEVRSAGPDRVMWTADDVVTR